LFKSASINVRGLLQVTVKQLKSNVHFTVVTSYKSVFATCTADCQPLTKQATGRNAN